MVLLEKLKALGVDRSRLPENIADFFGTFASETQNVIKACDIIRNSPLTGPKIPVHGLVLDIETGRLDWLVNGYQTLQVQVAPALPGSIVPKFGELTESLGSFKDFAMGEMKFPEMKIGELGSHAGQEIGQTISQQAATLRTSIEQKIVPITESVQQVVEDVQQYAEKKWPQPPPIRPKPSPLPPIKKKNPLPPPIRPGTDFRRG